MHVCVPHECLEPTVTRSSVTYEIGVADGYKLPSSCWDTHTPQYSAKTNKCLQQLVHPPYLLLFCNIWDKLCNVYSLWYKISLYLLF